MVDVAFGSAVNIRINEIYYDPAVPSADEARMEFIELYVAEGGIDPSHWYLTDWDENNYWEIPKLCPEVATGDFIVVHIGPGVDDIQGPVYHFYMGNSNSQLSNIGDPITLHFDDDSNHDRLQDEVLDFVTYEGGSDSELSLCNPWAGWPNDGTDPTDPGAEAPNDLGKSMQLFGEDLDNGSNWMAGPPTEGRENSLVGEVYWSENIREVRNQVDGTIVGVTAAVHSPIGAVNYERRQFWLQDETAGIVVDNTPEKTSIGYQPGDIVSVTGTLTTRYGERQIKLEGGPGAPHGTAQLQPPISLSVETFRENLLNGPDEYQGCLVRLENIWFDSSYRDCWESDTSYRIRQAGSPEGSATVYIRIEDGCELVGEPLPEGISMTVTGMVSRFYNYPRILPRYCSDLEYEPFSTIEGSSWRSYR